MSEIRNYLLENIEELESVTRELNDWNGSFENLDVRYNDEEFFNVLFEGKPMEAVRAACYGDYNYMDEYVRFNGYGNLESLNEYTYHKELKESVDEIIDALLEYRGNLYLSDKIMRLLDQEEEDE